MIYGIGIDLIEVRRIALALQSTARFKTRIFTAEEISYCEQQAYPPRHYAARFAAKEAFFKAIGKGYRDSLAFSEVSVSNDELGQPHLQLSGKCAAFAQENTLSNFYLSLTHTADYAAAVVIIEKQ